MSVQGGEGSFAAGVLDIEARKLRFSAPQSFLAYPPYPMEHQQLADWSIGGTIGPRHDGVRLRPCLFSRSVMPNAIEMLRMEEFGCPSPPPSCSKSRHDPLRASKPGHARVVGGAVKVPGSL